MAEPLRVGFPAVLFLLVAEGDVVVNLVVAVVSDVKQVVSAIFAAVFNVVCWNVDAQTYCLENLLSLFRLICSLTSGDG